MASTDARPIPLKNAAYRFTFPVMVAVAAVNSGLPSGAGKVLLSRDGGPASGSTNAVVAITGMQITGNLAGEVLQVCYLDLTAAEMNCDTLVVGLRTAAAKATPFVLNPVAAAAAGVPVVPGVPGEDDAAMTAALLAQNTLLNSINAILTNVFNNPQPPTGGALLAS